MRVQVNEKELKREWVCNKWYDKTVYVVGYITVAYLALCFIAGVFVGISQL